LGMSYQIIDDCLDFAPRSEDLGKNRLMDIKNAVPSLPLLLAGRKPCLRAEVRRLLAKKRDGAMRERIGSLIRTHGLVRAAAMHANSYLVKARADMAFVTTWGRPRAARVLEGYVEEQARAIAHCATW